LPILTEPEQPIEQLRLGNLRRLAQRLSISLGDLQSLAESASTYYKPFSLVPEQPLFSRKPPKKTRPIDRPTGLLVQVQREINSVLLRPILLPEHINGAVPKRTILKNAEMHRGASVLVTLDITQCFPSITPTQVYGVWARTLGCSPEVSSLLTVLTTFKRRLPQGAPTSPALANLFIWSIDEPIRNLCRELGLAYSTWLDDLAFSGDRAREIIQPALQCLAAQSLRVSHRKTRVMGRNCTKKLTGTRLGLFETRLTKEYLSNVRAAIWTLSQGKVPPAMLERNAGQLAARLRYVARMSDADSRPLVKHLKKHIADFPPCIHSQFDVLIESL